MSIESIAMWHKRARPEPDDDAFNVQLGCHLEEVLEMLEVVMVSGGTDVLASYQMAVNALTVLSQELKHGANAVVLDREEFLDSLGDQIVTAVGVGHCAKMKVVEAVNEVDRSNWSKFNYKGFPEFNEYGKIAKGEQYSKPNLEGMF